jgi:Cu(I)/Ag(I) efflux system membrane fusion protein
LRHRLAAGSIVLAIALFGCNPAESPAADNSGTPEAGGTYSTTGEVTDVSDGSVTINHQPVPALGWPAMTMIFKAPDSAMTGGLQTGAHVEFSFRPESADNVLTEVKRQ